MAASQTKCCGDCRQLKPLSDFNLNQSLCRPCQSARFRKWRETNRAHHAERNNRWYHDHKDRAAAGTKKYREQNAEVLAANKRAYHEKNAEKIRAKVRVWQKANPEKRLVHSQKRRALKRGLPNDWMTADIAFALSHWDGRCAACRQGGALYWDHWVPLTDPACPGTVPGNMIPLCLFCNSTKQDRAAAKWLKERFPNKADEIFRRVADYFASARPPTPKTQCQPTTRRPT